MKRRVKDEKMRKETQGKKKKKGRDVKVGRK